MRLGIQSKVHTLALVAQLFTGICYAGNFTYEIDLEIRYDFVADGVVHPDTVVWGLAAGEAGPSGTLELAIDEFGNLSGASTVDPLWGMGLLRGRWLINWGNFTFGLSGGSWETPTEDVAPIVAGTVTLNDTSLGDFARLNVASGFILDGNSAGFFDLSNGVGINGKLEFTIADPGGASLSLKTKGFDGVGTGWHRFTVDGGSLGYDNGAATVSIGVNGVVTRFVWMDPMTQTFSVATGTSLPAIQHGSAEPGRWIDSFSGTIDATGNFVGTAHFAGIEFISLTVGTTTGTFSDGNSPGFNAGNGMTLADTFTAVMTDATGVFDLVINGTLVSQDGCQSDADCDDGVACTVDTCEANHCVHANAITCDDGVFCTTGETCVGGVCGGGMTTDCSALANQCNTGVCNLTADMCEAAPVTNGTACDDSMFCTTGETCVGGVCGGGTTTDCSALANQCNTGVCNLTTDMCEAAPVTNGTACDDSVFCTENDVCTTGVCAGRVVPRISFDMETDSLSSAVTRDVTFLITTCGIGVELRVVGVAFDATGFGTAALEDVDPNAEWVSVQEGHTLSRLEAVVFDPCLEAAVDLTGPNQLLSGDFYTDPLAIPAVPKDNLVDIVDFSILSSQWNTFQSPSLSYGADATGDGVQDTADFTAVAINFFEVGEAADGCVASLLPSVTPPKRPWDIDINTLSDLTGRLRISTRDVGIPRGERADLDGDGDIDPMDIVLFAHRHNLPLDPGFVHRVSRMARAGKSRTPGRR